MAKKGTYYLGRVILGRITEDDFLNALINAPIITKAQFSWTITRYRSFGTENRPKFVFGRLVKFEKRGDINIIDPERRDEITAEIENRVVASSPFVYIPRYSGIAYLHIWNQIQREIFPLRFSDIIESYFGHFFSKCEIDPITDYRTFTKRLLELDNIHKISSRVIPPNPLFGILWKPLKQYLKKRKADEMRIEEIGKDDVQLATKLINLLMKIQNGKVIKEDDIEYEIGDAAVLMAADGYGKAKVEGRIKNTEVIVRTAENRKSFLFEKEPDPDRLYEKTKELLEQINKERYLKH